MAPTLSNHPHPEAPENGASGASGLPVDTRRPGRVQRLGHLLATRCPRCYRGRLFLHMPYRLFGIGKMPESCRVCGLNYEPEPGFYFGALFISYALAAPFCLLLFLGLNMGLGVHFEAALVLVTITQLALAPYLFHLSRAIWLYFHASYEPQTAEMGPQSVHNLSKRA